MIGEKVCELTGKVIGTRVLPSTTTTMGMGPCMEMTVQQNGRMLGVEGVDMGTYSSHMLTHGNAWCGEGTGVFTTKEGEMVSWKASGIGKPTGRGNAMMWRGSVYYQTTSTKLAKLNGNCFVFEYEMDENGTCGARCFEWK